MLNSFCQISVTDVSYQLQFIYARYLPTFLTTSSCSRLCVSVPVRASVTLTVVVPVVRHGVTICVSVLLDLPLVVQSNGPASDL